MRRDWRRKRSSKAINRNKILYLNKDNRMIDCWRFDRAYQKLDGFSVYQKWAAGTGYVARHLCSNNRCINPLHIVRGTDIENAIDELEVRDFSIKLLEDLTNDYSLRNEDIENDMKILILVPRAVIALKEVYGFKYMNEVTAYCRERFRMNYVHKLTEQINSGLISDEIAERINMAKDLFQALRMRNDITIQLVMEGL